MHYAQVNIKVNVHYMDHLPRQKKVQPCTLKRGGNCKEVAIVERSLHSTEVVIVKR